MADSSTLKKRYGVTPTGSLRLPDWKQPCDHCQRITPTEVLFMRQGFGNACAVCGCLRRGKPYLSKAEFNTLKPTSAAKGGCHEQAEVV